MICEIYRLIRPNETNVIIHDENVLVSGYPFGKKMCSYIKVNGSWCHTELEITNELIYSQ